MRETLLSKNVEQLGIPSIIAIDGPAASGKSTLARCLARDLGYLYFDTGVMYRTVTWVAIQREVPLVNESAVTAIAEKVRIDVHPPSQDDGRYSDVVADGEDVTSGIRRSEVDANVSMVSAYPGVRKALTTQQRRIGMQGQVVMVGRDIGTVVLPEAELKIYLDASVEERARRRFIERKNRGEEADYAEILETMRKRDQIDTTRDLAPLRPAEDAVIIDSDGLDADQVLSLVLELVRGKRKPELDG
ncbi:MAG: (d)CMP kinase [Anaerolineales bacterium]|jgi:cytidylate kinase